MNGSRLDAAAVPMIDVSAGLLQRIGMFSFRCLLTGLVTTDLYLLVEKRTRPWFSMYTRNGSTLVTTTYSL